MDPFSYLPIEITEKILGNISTQELLTATEVSSSWNRLIGKNSEAMKRITLKIHWNDEENLVNLLLKSQRNYQNVEIKNWIPNEEAEELLRQIEPSWKNVKIKQVNSVSMTKFINFLGIIEPSVKKLSLENISINIFDNENRLERMEDLEFSKLEVLRLKRIRTWPFLEAFERCKALKSLAVYPSRDAGFDVVNILLHQNSNITELETKIEAIERIEIFNMKRLSLKSFIIKGSPHAFSSERYTKFMLKLNQILMCQKETLEKFSYEGIFDIEICKVLFQMNKISSVTLGSYNELTNFNLDLNFSLLSLKIIDLRVAYNFLDTLINASPNLTKIELIYMDQRILQLISINAMRLQTIKVLFFDANNLNIVNLLPNLQKIKISAITRDLRHHIERIPVQNHFVKLVMENENLFNKREDDFRIQCGRFIGDELNL
ncbi:CLUMA_CG004071, isoform A [Clunio marinus]|uniref:CLUMA_CG004071, isoform A n=1 Tax=Clunio marinus TaxID=568069 RepID=A0A1J1HUY8_9DIPT|nr:CLUMA_CG004071, isoform A [Clunio marinus]